VLAGPGLDGHAFNGVVVQALVHGLGEVVPSGECGDHAQHSGAL
jgi:hypothetical protein